MTQLVTSRNQIKASWPATIVSYKQAALQTPLLCALCLQAAEYWQLAFLSLLSMVQSMVVWVGLAGGLVVCIWGCSRGTLTVGDTVLFITMMQQLYVPLTYFGSYYRQVIRPGRGGGVRILGRSLLGLCCLCDDSNFTRRSARCKQCLNSSYNLKQEYRVSCACLASCWPCITPPMAAGFA